MIFGGVLYLNFEKLMDPGNIGKMRLKNRLVVPAMVTMYANEDGTISKRYINYLEARAKGGWGLIITEDQRISEDAGGFFNLPGLWNDSQIERQKMLTSAVHTHGAKIAAQIYHAGRQTTKSVTGKQPVGPSHLADPITGEVPRELSVREIRDIKQKFADAALMAKNTGYDAVEVHGAHGYLISTFLSPFSNKRTDDYGGNLINRSRFALEIVNAIQEKTGTDYPIIFRISADELLDNGLTIEDTKIIASLLEDAGVDAIHVSVGVNATSQYTIAPSAVSQGWATDYADKIRSVINIPVITVNRITQPYMAESILKGGKADFVAMGRASLADPELPLKAQKGDLKDINYCIGCRQGCIGQLIKNRPIGCLVNPLCGHENEFSHEKVSVSKKVMIVGGGPAGMTAAIFTAKRGHEVHLYEKNDRLGGQWLLASMPHVKEEYNQMVVWQKNQLKNLGVNITLNKMVDEKLVEKINPDVLVIATGSIQYPIEIPGIEHENVAYTNDVLSGKADVGKNVLIIGGGLGGPQTAEFLVLQGHLVTLITKSSKISPKLEGGTRFFLLKILKEHEVNIITDASTDKITSEGVIFSVNGETCELNGFDTILVSSRLKPLEELKSLESKYHVVVIGDAKKIDDGLNAVKDGFESSMKI